MASMGNFKRFASFLAGAGLLYIGYTNVMSFISILQAMVPLATNTPLTNQMIFFSAILEAYGAMAVISFPTGISLIWGVIMSLFDGGEN